MSSLSWDFPPSSTNPSGDDDDGDDVGGVGRPEGESDDHDESSPVGLIDREASEREQIEALERELLEQLGRDQIEPVVHEQIESLEREQGDQLEREQIEELEREQLERLERLAAAEIELSPQSEREQLEELEREQLEELEREQLRQLERLQRQQSADMGAAPRPPPAERPTPNAQTGGGPSAAVAHQGPGIDDRDADAQARVAQARAAQARAAEFLAAASERQALDEARAVQPWDAATERRELNEPARAARAIVEHRHQNLVEANALLTDARRVLAPIAYRGLSDRIYRRRKVILAIGEAVSLAVAFSAAFDVAPLEALLLSGAIALAFVIAGDLGGILRLTAERSRLSAAVEDGAAHLDPRYLHILYYDRQPWLSIVGGATAGLFGLAAVTVGVLRAANRGSFGLAAGLGLLTLSLAIAAGLSSWQHASIGSEVIDHLQREEEAAARRLKRAAAARVLRSPQILTAVRSEELAMPSQASAVDWQAPAADWQGPNMDWQAPAGEQRAGEKPAKRPKRGGRAARERPAKREKSSGGLVGAAAARGAVFFATLPGKLRRSERPASKKEDSEDMWAGEGPGAGGESAGPISDISFKPPVIIQRKFP